MYYGWTRLRGVAREDMIYPPEDVCWILNHVGLIALGLLAIVFIWRLIAKKKDHGGMSYSSSEMALAAIPPFVAVLYIVKLWVLENNGYDLEHLILVDFLTLSSFVVSLLSFEGYYLLKTPSGKDVPEAKREKHHLEKSPWRNYARWTCMTIAVICLLIIILPLLWRILLIILGIIVIICIFL